MKDKEKKSGGATTVKGFFRSNAFKCIAVLLAIVLVCGILLTICNSLFYVSAEEQLQRAISKIYGRTVTATAVELDSPNIESFEIEQNGSTSDSFIENMADGVKDGSLFRYKTESQIASLLNADGEFTAGNMDDTLHTGATYSSYLATYAALFAAANYNVLKDGQLSDTEVIKYTTYIDSYTYTAEGTGSSAVVNYSITTTGLGRVGAFTLSISVRADGVITAYEIVTNGSTADRYVQLMPENVRDGSLYIGRDLSGLTEIFSNEFAPDDVDDSIMTGATYSNFLCAYGALFAAANYNVLKDGQLSDTEVIKYTTYIDSYTYTAEGTGSSAVVNYSITTTGLGRVGAFTLSISVRGSFETEYSAGNVNSVYYIEEDGNYLVNSRGTGGFSGGSVTCWVVVAMTDGEVSGVDKVVIDSNSGQSYINKVDKDSVLSRFEGTFDSGDEANAWQGTGATYSLTAIANSINTAMQFVREQLTTAQADILGDALKEIYGDTEVTATEIDLSALDATFANGTIEQAYSIEETGDILVLSTGTGGFSNGTVTCWVQVQTAEGAVSGIGRVIIQSNVAQSYIDNVNKDEVLGDFSSSFDGGDFTAGDIIYSGATAPLTLNAIINSVNTAMTFVNGGLAAGGAQ